ncbi:conserved protein of unknown function [Pararobbsia alpina]|uniref:hypothetical protein n=1 Tax=Pararobbsia alpina TaxID=621374 RepID=UPI0039A7343F
MADDNPSDPVQPAVNGDAGTQLAGDGANGAQQEAKGSPDAQQDINSTTDAQPVKDAPEPDGATIFKAVRNAFSLGWSLVELTGRIESELGEVEQRGMRVASLWRVSLSRIASMHYQAFGGTTTDKTFYAPQVNLPGYLFPAAGPNDYTQFSSLNPKADQDRLLVNFKLYDVTKRAINCLALLYVNPEDSLDSDRIKNLQDLLIAADSALQSSDNPKEQITTLVKRFLIAWDGFLREHFYAGGLLPDTDLEVTAYEAGRSMASLSWSITSKTLDWERTLPSPVARAGVLEGNQRLVASRASVIDDIVRNDGVGAAWQSAFRQDFIIRLQHDVVALSSKLDEAYLAQHSADANVAGKSAKDVDADLPSVSIRAIKQGLEFWRRAVEKMLKSTQDPSSTASASDPKVNVYDDYRNHYEWSRTMRLALTKQVSIWQTLITGQQSLRAFSTENIAQKLVDEVWTEIQAGLAEDIGETVRHAEDAAAELAKEATEAAGKAIDKMFVAARAFIWPLGILAVAVIGIGVILLFGQYDHAGTRGASGALSVAGIGAAAAGVLKWLGISTDRADAQASIQAAAKPAPSPNAQEAQAPGIVNRVEQISRSFASDAMNALKNGFGQAQTELDDLNRSVSVTYPLVDYIALQRTLVSGGGNVPSSVQVLLNKGDFLRDVIWTSDERAEEMKAIVRAAFGPIAMLAYSAVKDPSKLKEAKSPEQ